MHDKKPAAGRARRHVRVVGHEPCKTLGGKRHPARGARGALEAPDADAGLGRARIFVGGQQIGVQPSGVRRTVGLDGADLLLDTAADLLELRDLRGSCERVFVPEGPLLGDQPRTKQPDLFSTAVGFYLCSLQGQSLSSIPPLPLPEPLVFPARTAFLLSIRILSASTDDGKEAPDHGAGPWWSTLYWEKVEEVPLRKTGTAR